MHAEHGQEIGRDAQRGQLLGLTEGGQGCRADRVSAHLFENIALVAPRLELGIGDRRRRSALRHVPNDDELVGIREWDRAQDCRIHDTKDRAAAADAERKAADGRRSEAQILPKHPQREADVLHDVSHRSSAQARPL